MISISIKMGVKMKTPVSIETPVPEGFIRVEFEF